jgi:hypothetical protein
MSRFPLRFYIRDYAILIPIVLAFIFLVSNWVYGVTHIKPVADGVYLHYDAVVGPDLHGEWWKIYYFSIAGTIFFIINNIVSYFFYRTDKTFSRAFTFATLLMEIFLFAGIYLIVGINY